jgi:hypothetical protein
MTPRILSLILPENSRWRFLRNGRKGIGFNKGALVTRTANGVEVGVSEVAPGDVDTTVTGTTKTIEKRVTVFTSTSAITATLPPASGPLRDVIIIKASATSAITANRAGTNTIVSGAGAAGTSATIAASSSARFISDGVSKWYRIA